MSEKIIDSGSEEKSSERESEICFICQAPIQSPRLLECLHSFCLHCIQSLEVTTENKSKSIKCPDCFEIVAFHEQESKFIQDYTKLASTTSPNKFKQFEKKSSTCDLCCSSDRPESFCYDCNAGLCTFCTHAHKRQKITNSHKLEMLDNAAIVCSYHPSEQVTLYCLECDILACRDCFITVHRNHDCQFIDEIETDFANELANQINGYSDKLSKLTDRLVNVKHRKIDFEAETESATTQVNQFYDGYIVAIESHRNEVLEKLEKRTILEIGKLDEEINQLQEVAVATEHGIETAILSNEIGGSHMLQMMPLIQNRFKILEERTKLMNTCSRFAGIVFDEEKKVQKDSFGFNGDLNERKVAKLCKIQNLTSLKNVRVGEPFELLLNARNCDAVLIKSDIEVQLVDSRTGEFGKTKIKERNDGIFLIRFMITTPNIHTITIKIDGLMMTCCPLKILHHAKQTDSNSSLNPSDPASSPMSIGMSNGVSPISKQPKLQTVTL